MMWQLHTTGKYNTFFHLSARLAALAEIVGVDKLQNVRP
jgi:hypothetical protein